MCVEVLWPWDSEVGAVTRLFLDFETRSEIDLHERGLANYLQHGSTTPLMLSWALDDGLVNLWQKHLDGKFCPELKEALADPRVTKVAFNAPFEHGVFKYLFGKEIPYDQWLDVLIWARHLSVTGDLAEVGEVFGIPADEAKIKDGERLIDLFSKPCLTESLFGVLFNNWDTHPKDWEKFGQYCRNDVSAERSIFRRMAKFPLPDREQQGWLVDRRINDRGLHCDLDLVRGGMAVAEQSKSELRAKLIAIMGVENPNSGPQVLAWIKPHGYTFSSIGKPFVNRALAGECKLTDAAKEALGLRKQFTKSSDSKLGKIVGAVSPDGRLRDQFSYMGAARTARWSGHTVQMQNLPRPSKEVSSNLDCAIRLLKKRDYLGLSLEFASPMDAVVSTIRSVVRAAPGKKLLVADLNAVEFRALGWITGCEEINGVFRKGLCPYKDFGVDLFGKPYDQITKEERQNAKPGVLGGGYQLSGGEPKVDEKSGDLLYTGLMGYGRGLGIELTQELAHDSIARFRERYKIVVDFWYLIEKAGIAAMRTRNKQEAGPFVIEYFPSDDILRMMLPSGRGLHYLHPKIEKNRFDKDGITYEGRLQAKKVRARMEMYGGKWVENGDQSFSRDLLLNGMFLAEKKGIPVIGHTHDELICEVDKDSKFGLDDLIDCMTREPEWAPGLILGAEGYETDGPYRKD